MTKIKLGLPLEYQKLSEYFDAHNVSDETESKNAVIEKILKKYKVNTVLDLTCGTGSQVFFLAKYGYKLVGADFSPALLEIARARARKEKIYVKFIDGDMRTLQVGVFDAVISIFNAIGHLTKADFAKAIRNVYKNLNPGGIFIFDIFNLEAISDEAVKNFAMQVRKQINDTQFFQIQCSTINREQGLLTSYDSYMIQKKAEAPQIFANKFSLQIYTAAELRAMLEKNGFKVLEQLGLDGSNFKSGISTSILTVAKKC